MTHGRRGKAFENGSWACILLLWCKRGREIKVQVKHLQWGRDTVRSEMGMLPHGKRQG